MADSHALEKRSNMLAQRLQERVELMANMMRPDDRKMFSDRLPERDALNFWRKHRYDDLGQSVLSTWEPDKIIALDQRLMQAGEANGVGGGDLGQPGPY